jgi:two-component system chemotaxis response regulator CheB
MIRVLIVDDSAVMRELIARILTNEGRFEIVGTAANGDEAVRRVLELKPDVVTMDIFMPKMDGFEATRIIMESRPTPIVIVSASYDSRDVEKAMATLQAGAVAALEKPVAVSHPRHESMAAELARTVRLMSEVKVFRRPAVLQPVEIKPPVEHATSQAKAQIIAIGASTGGPPVLKTLLSSLPKDIGVPIAIIQHMAPGFIRGFAEWLDASSPLSVSVAANGEYVLPGRVYIAPSGLHMSIDGDRRVVLFEAAPEYGVCPAVSHLFRSIANVFRNNALGILLTGMGRDGAAELKQLKERGSITIVQDEESCVIFGMPGEAVKLGAATHVLSPEKIIQILPGLVSPWAMPR